MSPSRASFPAVRRNRSDRGYAAIVTTPPDEPAGYTEIRALPSPVRVRLAPSKNPLETAGFSFLTVCGQGAQPARVQGLCPVERQESSDLDEGAARRPVVTGHIPNEELPDDQGLRPVVRGWASAAARESRTGHSTPNPNIPYATATRLD
jgi:hypothetical protein